MKTFSSESIQKFKQVQVLFRQQQFVEAKALCLEVFKVNQNSEQVLNALVQICLQLNQLTDAVRYLQNLIAVSPSNLQYRNLLTNIFGQMGEWQKACDCYRSYLEIDEKSANAYFNYAYYLRKNTQFKESIDNYHTALELEIDGKEEVYLNIALIYSDDLRRESQAEENLLKALKINDRYLPAMYNLANLHEQSGSKERSLQLFQKIVGIDPHHYDALARIADLKKNSSTDTKYIKQLELAVKRPNVEKPALSNLYFALGKSYDDCAAYNRAFENYRLANQINGQLQNKYDHQFIEKKFDAVKTFFNTKWFEKLPTISDEKYIFICGMFRSGSTLTEQILAAHPKVTAGGEREFFVRLEQKDFSTFPGVLETAGVEYFKRISSEYTQELRQAFPDAKHITDKRPDNFVYVGLIKSLFPNARFIHTLRNPLDNCLSVYFLRLGNAMNYSNELLNIAHYYRQQMQLMAHWKKLFGENIFEVSYDDLVASPEQNIRKMLEFLELDWDSACLNFHHNKNVVKTASVWQVRQPLYQSSSGRWKNYRAEISDLINYFGAQ